MLWPSASEMLTSERITNKEKDCSRGCKGIQRKDLKKDCSRGLQEKTKKKIAAEGCKGIQRKYLKKIAAEDCKDLTEDLDSSKVK